MCQRGFFDRGFPTANCHPRGASASTAKELVVELKTLHAGKLIDVVRDEYSTHRQRVRGIHHVGRTGHLALTFQIDPQSSIEPTGLLSPEAPAKRYGGCRELRW